MKDKLIRFGWTWICLCLAFVSIVPIWYRYRRDQVRKHRALVVRGTALYNSGKYVEAIKNLREAISLQPGDGLDYVRLGQSYERGGDLSQAVAAYREAMRLMPLSNDPDVKGMLQHALDSQAKAK